jgi:O-antigen ligase
VSAQAPRANRRTSSARLSAVNAETPPKNLSKQWFEGALGAFLGLTILKFANPPIMEDKWVTVPADIYQFLLGPWPISWAYRLLAALTIGGLLVATWRFRCSRWLVAMPLVWFGWQLLSATETVDARLTGPTLIHFGACVTCFYLGFFALSNSARPTWFWLGIIAGFLLAMAVGWEQHFGGLEATRRYFKLYESELFPHGAPPEYIKKMSSNRIFATFFYPNTLAGGVLLLLPPILGVLSQAKRLFTVAARGFLMGVTALAALACLYWSASKGGWLLMLLLGLLALWRLPMNRNRKASMIGVLLIAGLAGFWWKHAAFFERGATSVSARFDYWRAALETARAHPFLGTGPATFSLAYSRLKKPESEMARLTHNDYLQQASDSGLPGFLAYAIFIGGALVYSTPFRFRQAKTAPPDKEQQNPGSPSVSCDWVSFSVWLGVLGFALQQFAEFGLYIPNLAWPAFVLMGWLLRRATEGNIAVG